MAFRYHINGKEVAPTLNNNGMTLMEFLSALHIDFDYGEIFNKGVKAYDIVIIERNVAEKVANEWNGKRDSDFQHQFGFRILNGNVPQIVEGIESICEKARELEINHIILEYF